MTIYFCKLSGQLAQVRKMTLSKLLCVTMQAAKHMQPNAFDMPDEFLNKPVLCDDLPDLDLTPWKENGGNEALHLIFFLYDEGRVHLL